MIDKMMNKMAFLPFLPDLFGSKDFDFPAGFDSWSPEQQQDWMREKGKEMQNESRKNTFEKSMNDIQHEMCKAWASFRA